MIIDITEQNIEQEHICCAISDKKHQNGVQLKKSWLKKRFTEGLKFKKLNVRGKVFIEYIPAELGWRPVHAEGYMLIHCLWVSGRYKGQGYGKQLLAYCLEDAKDMKGVVVVTSKESYLTNKQFFENAGFTQCDTAPPYFELMVKKFDLTAPDPQFYPTAKTLKHSNKDGIVVTYAEQCPFIPYYLNEMKRITNDKNLNYTIQKITTSESAKTVPSAYGVFNVFLNGQFLTHRVLSTKQFEKLLEQHV